MGKIEWSDLPEELVDLISDRLSSNTELLRIRSICKPWRSAVAMKKRFQNCFQRNLSSLHFRKHTRLFPTTFYRVTLPSSCSSKGWLIRTRQVSESCKNNLLSPLSRHLISTPSNKTLDLLKFAVSEISQSYEIQYLFHQEILSSRVVFINNMFFAVDIKNKILCGKNGEERKSWKRIKTQVKDFSDIILHRGNIYALDFEGAIWWISLSHFSTVQYTPSTPLNYYGIDSCKEKRLVEYCGNLCVVHRFYKNFGVAGAERTIGFRVYKMDEDLAKWVNVCSLGDKALIVAVDSCFTVVASEYYGCLENSIYFTDSGGLCRSGTKVEDVKVFKLEDGSIITEFSNFQSCFHMFSPPFL